MDQITKFYITSFLKNQTYFTPVFVVILQLYHLSLDQVFWVLTLGSVAALIFEIPTGVFADLFGKKFSLIISRIIIFGSFLIFGFASSFWVFVIAQILFEIGNSFSTGTESAYVFDYLAQAKVRSLPRIKGKSADIIARRVESYTKVKGRQKFYALVSAAIATAVGGLIATYISYNAVFFFTAGAVFLNLCLVLSFTKINEKKASKVKEFAPHVKSSIIHIWHHPVVRTTFLNFSLFAAVFVAFPTLLQPYMLDVGVPVAWFGFIYSGFMVLTALAVRYTHALDRWVSKKRLVDIMTYIAIIPAFIIGLGHVSWFGIVMFFLASAILNSRSPHINDLFHSKVPSKKRATIGSLQSLAQALAKILILPLVGFIAGSFSIYHAALAISFMVALIAVLLSINRLKPVSI